MPLSPEGVARLKAKLAATKPRVEAIEVSEENQPVAPPASTAGGFLADIPSPEQILQDPNSGMVGRAIAGTMLGVKNATQSAAKAQQENFLSPTALLSPWTTPVAGVIGGVAGSGLLSPETISKRLDELSTLTNATLPFGLSPVFQAEYQAAKGAAKMAVAAKWDGYLKLRGVRPPSLPRVVSGVEVLAPPVTPPTTPVLDNLAPAVTEVAENLGSPVHQAAVKNYLDTKIAPELRSQFEGVYKSLSKIHSPEKAAEMMWGKGYKISVGKRAKVAPKEVATVDLPAGEPIEVSRPTAGTVTTTAKLATPLEDKKAAEVLLAEPKPTVDGVVDYGPVYDPSMISASKSAPGQIWDRILKAADNIRWKLPADVSIAKEAPNSWVLTDLEAWHQMMSKFMHDFVDQPWYKWFRNTDDATIKALEHQAVDIWEKGGKTAGSYRLAVQGLPQELQDYMAWRASRLAIEQGARGKLALTSLDFTNGPYIARIAKQDFDNLFKLRGGKNFGLAADIQQSIGGFANARTYRTMMEGEGGIINGKVVGDSIEYIPVNHAVAMREFEGSKLVETANLMERLEAHRVLFRDKATAMTNSPTNTAFKIEGLPGSSKQAWYAATRSEAKLLEQNLSRAEGMGLGRTNFWLSQAFRNLNLINPFPHFTKNMLYKFWIAGGKVGFFGNRVKNDMFELLNNTNPAMIADFKKYMPYNQFGETAQSIMSNLLREGGEKYITKLVEKINSPSSSMLFGKLDPALRYSLWKQKVASGMTPMEAANHVQVDLVRYGTRSDWVDFWKSIPMNFFVPWRIGSVTSVVKQLAERPMQTAIKIGFLDYIRESIYRNTGQYFHMPIDYVTGPIVQTIESGRNYGPVSGLTTAGGLAIATRIAGPGGAWSVGQLGQALSAIAGRGDQIEWQRIGNLFWGASLVLNVPMEGYKAAEKATPEAIAEFMMKAAGSIAFGAHEAYSYEPNRFGMYLPEWLPGLAKSDKFKTAENIRETFKTRGIIRDQRMQVRKDLLGRTAVQRALKAAGVTE